MPELHLPPGQEIRLYATDAFLAAAHEAGARQFDINADEVRDVIRAARASETIPNLGGVALLTPLEVETAGKGTEVVPADQPLPPEERLARQVMLTQFAHGRPLGRESWGRIIMGHAEEQTSLFSLGVEPDESKIALALYKAAFVLPGNPSNDDWVKDRMRMAADLLSFRFGLNIVSTGLEAAGKNIGKMRQWVDLRKIDDRRPILLHGAISQ